MIILNKKKKKIVKILIPIKSKIQLIIPTK